MKTVITKLILGTINEQELNDLKKWLKDPKHKSVLNGYLRDHYDLNLAVLKNNAEEGFQNVEKRIETRANRVKTIPLYKRSVFKYAVAASIAILISLTFIFNNDTSQVIEPIIVNNNIKPGHNEAILTLNSGEEVTLVKGASFQTQNATSNGEAIIYDNNTSRELVYNHLTIPRGGQFQLTLSDGTQVWLNSETQLKYPVSFAKGESRQVELVYGEAYFDVSPSTDHNGATFKVFNNNQDVEVLGTEFNIKAYMDETNIYTTLVEGSVAVSAANQGMVLAPNEQSNLDIKTNALSVSVINVKNEISWKEGVFRFKDMSLKHIMKVLSRWYDVDVVFENKALEGDAITFKGVLGRNQSIEAILSAIKNSKTISNYEVNDKTIILK